VTFSDHADGRCDREQEAYHALCAYTLGHRGPEFIHQHVVDAYAAQRADERSKPIGVAFALVGLYLLVEKNWTGRQVQRAHMQLARTKRTWPRLMLPAGRGRLTAADVMSVPAGSERDAVIYTWCRSVWAAYAHTGDVVAGLLEEHGIV
jgi:hypothetical protein